MKSYYSTKYYGGEQGFSCAFRQWKADSHCNLIHGYGLRFKLTFGACNLDDRNWVVDFGGLKVVKEWLKYNFDHTYCVASDDPELDTFRDLSKKDLVNLRVVTATGCEATAEMVFNHVKEWLWYAAPGDRVWLESVEVSEHEGNSAIVKRDF